MIKSIKKSNRCLLAIIFIFFIPPFLFPTFPENYWQRYIYDYITKTLCITIGTKGNLPFFTILASIYTAIIMFILSIYVFSYINKQKFSKEYQKEFYTFFLKNNLVNSISIKLILVSFLFFIGFLGGILHFRMDEISILSTSKNLIQISYNFRIGIIFWEIIFNFFLVIPIIYLFCLFVYLFNLFKRVGLGK